MTLTRDARAALARAGLSRRDFLKTSGVLVVGFAGAAGPLAQGPFDTRMQQVDPRRLDSWIAIAADGTVTAYTGKCELGQGMATAQAQLVAEELSVAIGRVRLIECDTSITPDQGTTSGSQSTPANFNHRNLALAGATARETLLKFASERLGVPIDRLAIEDGVVTAPASDGGAAPRVSYAELVTGRTLSVPLSATARRRPAAEWRVLGRPVGRLDMAELATGRFEFVHNVRVPGMLHGRVVRPASVGATLASVDEASVARMPGVVKVVVRKNFVGVVAEKPWQAMQAASALKVSWTPGPPLPSQSGIYEYLRTQPSQDSYLVDSGDLGAQFARAAAVVKATYLHPYQAHASMGASCAVADVRADRATIWSPTQSVYPTRNTAAMLLGLTPEAVRVVYRRGAGCYGLSGADTASYDAALLSQAAGRPVRVQLSRKDEFAWENYGYPYVIEQRAGIGSDGRILAWDHEAWFAALGNRPGYDRPGNVITGFLAGFEPERPSPRAAAPPSSAYRNGSNAAPSYVTGCVGGRCGGTGRVASERVLTHMVVSPFFTGPLRSPSRLQNTFAHESFIDEVAAHVAADPVEYRLRHIADPRLSEVVRAAAKGAGWDSRPSPRRDAPAAGRVRGRGMACVVYEGDNGYAAMVADVDVDVATGHVSARRFVVAQDVGPVSNPDGLRNQVEGGALQGLSRALGEEVTWDAANVTSVDWRTYRSLPLGFEVPVVETILLNRPEAEATGAGETAITLVAAAVANAIFDATGARVRQVPFTPDRVRAALPSK